MSRSVQDCISRKLWNFKRKMQDNFIFVGGTKCTCVVINVTYDKYDNTIQSVNSSDLIEVLMDFPNNDIPTSTMSSNSSFESQSNVLHMYDILPITAYFKNEDIIKYNIRRDSIILIKLRNFDNSFQVLKLQITDSISQGDISSGTYHHNFVVAPITSYEILNDSTFNSIVENIIQNQEW